jgi:hypothetical protein
MKQEWRIKEIGHRRDLDVGPAQVLTLMPQELATILGKTMSRGPLRMKDL